MLHVFQLHINLYIQACIFPYPVLVTPTCHPASAKRKKIQQVVSNTNVEN